ncbi:MAG: hypothetical protein ACI4JN_11420, partial [Ruminococcus sp.]
MEKIIDILNNLMEYRFIRIIAIVLVAAVVILNIIIKIREIVNNKKQHPATKKQTEKPRRTNAERVSVYKAGVYFSILAVFFVIGYVIYCFLHRDESKDESNVNISVFVAMVIAALLIANIIRLYLRNKRIDREIQENKSDAVTFLKESYEYHKNYTPIIPQEKSASANQVTSSSENEYSCKKETKPAEKEVRAEHSFNNPDETVKPCEINDEELMRKYDDECIRWREEREQKKLKNKDVKNILFSFIRKNLHKLVIIALSVVVICAIYANSYGISLYNFYDAIVKFIPSLGLVIGCFVIWNILRNKQPIEKSAVIYNELIPKMVKSHFGNAATFTQQSGFDCSEIYSNNSFRYHCYQTESAYFIDGTYRNMKFQLSCEQIRWGRIEETENGEKVVPEPLFNGFLICTEIPRQVESHLGIYPHRISELNDILENSVETATENLNFSRLFEI